MRKFILSLLAVAASLSLRAQTSVFQDGKGESAYKLLGNAVVINTSDKSLKTSFSVDEAVSHNNTHFNSWALNLNLAASDGLSAIKSDDGFLVNGSLGGSRIWKRTSDPLAAGAGWANAWYVSTNILVERNKLYDLSKTNDKVFEQGNFGWKAAGGRSGYTGDHLWGYELNLGQSTNAKDIKMTTVTTILPGGTDSIKLEKQQSAFGKSKFAGAQFNVQLNADYAWALTAAQAAANPNMPMLYLAGHFRSKIIDWGKPQLNPAIGFYLANPGKPQSISAGINLQASDILNALDAQDSSIGKRIGINFTAGFNF